MRTLSQLSGSSFWSDIFSRHRRLGSTVFVIGSGIIASRRRHDLVVLRALGLGDFLTAVPAFRGLRGAFPSHRITLATPGYFAPLARLAGAVDAILPTPGLEPLSWDGGPPDVAVNLHGRGPQSHRILRALSPKQLIAFAHPDVPDLSGPAWRRGEHEVVRWCRLLEAYGITADKEDLDLRSPVVASPAPGAVVIHPGAGSEARRWPAERYAAVARRLARDFDVVLTGTSREVALTGRVAEVAGLPLNRDLAGRITVVELAALVAGARLVVCGDTGIGHLATAYRTPSVLLFGPMSPEFWGPPPDRHEHAVLWSGHRGDPHGAVTDPGLLAIDEGDVIQAGYAQLRRAIDAS